MTTDTSYSKNQRTGNVAPAKVDLDDLKSRVDCRDIVREAWGQPKRTAPLRDTYFSHWRPDGNKASFVVSHDGFKDFGGTGESGDVFTFIQRELNCTFSQAIEWIENRLGNQTASMPRRQRQVRPAANEPPSNVWQNTAISFVEASQRELWKRPDILDYLRLERLFTDETIRAAGLGWNPVARKVNGFWVEAGLTIPRYQDGVLWFLNIRTVTGSFADFLGVPSHTRRNGESIDKYLCMAGSKLIGSFYNADGIRPGSPILFVEGELDCILAQQELGETVSVVTLGGATNRITPAWKARLLAFDVPIYIALDGDGAGQDATRHLITELEEKAKALRYPARIKDLTDFVNAGGDVRTWFASQTNRRVFADGPPVSWVSVIKNYMRPGAALLFVAMQEAARTGGINADQFCPQELYQWMQQNNYPVAYPTFYRYFETIIDELVSKHDIYSFTSERYKEYMSQNETNSRGKPSKYYCMVELPQLEKRIIRQAWARLYDREFATDGRKGTKARPRLAGLIRLGIPAAAAPDIVANLDKAYHPIYSKQSWAFKGAEKRIDKRLYEVKARLADLTPIKTNGHLLKNDSALEVCIVETVLKEGTPTGQKEIAQWIAKSRSYVSKVIAKSGFKGVPSKTRVIPIKPGQDIKKAAYEADPKAAPLGLKIDDNSTIQEFKQHIANRATKSLAMVIQPPNTYIYVGKAEPVEMPAPAEKPSQKIKVKKSTAAPEFKLMPYWGDDVSEEVDENQLRLGLHLAGWEYEQDTGFWIDPSGEQYCRTLYEAVQMQAGILFPAPKYLLEVDF